MEIWTIIWAIIISFSLISFTILSIKILFKGFDELKYMLSSMEANDEEKE